MNLSASTPIRTHSLWRCHVLGSTSMRMTGPCGTSSTTSWKSSPRPSSLECSSNWPGWGRMPLAVSSSLELTIAAPFLESGSSEARSLPFLWVQIGKWTRSHIHDRTWILAARSPRHWFESTFPGKGPSRMCAKPSIRAKSSSEHLLPLPSYLLLSFREMVVIKGNWVLKRIIITIILWRDPFRLGKHPISHHTDLLVWFVNDDFFIPLFLLLQEFPLSLLIYLFICLYHQTKFLKVKTYWTTNLKMEQIWKLLFKIF